MSVTFNHATGFPVKPQPTTRYWYVVWNAYCDSKSRIEAGTQEELDRLYEEGRDRGLYGSIYEGGTRQGYDPEKMKEYKSALTQIFMWSCVMPPEEDLKLTSWAKSLPPERADEIDPEAGSFVQTRTRLRLIKNALKYGATPPTP